MSNLFVGIYDFFVRHKWMLFSLLAVLVGVGTYLTLKVNYKEDISGFLPDKSSEKNIPLFLEKTKENDKLILILTGNDSLSSTQDALLEAASDLTSEIKRQLIPEYFLEIVGEISEEQAAEYHSMICRNLAIFLDEEDYCTINKRINTESIDSALKSKYKLLVTPAGTELKNMLLNDPLNFAELGLNKLNPYFKSPDYVVKDNHVFSRDKKSLLIFLRTSHTSAETSANSVMIERLESIISSVSKEHPQLSFQYFGAAAVAVCNSAQLKSDTLITMGLAVIIILIIFALFFRSIKTIFYLMMPVFFGGIFSLSLIYFIKNEISTIAIGAASIILGVALNYSIHFYAHYRHEKSIRQVISDLAAPLLTGSITTIGAFMGLLFVNSTMLNDFGLLSALVMLGSVIFTLIFMPFFVKNKQNETRDNVRNNFIDRLSSYRFEKNKWLLAAILILTIIFLIKVPDISFDSDISKMGYMSEKLKNAESSLDKILGNASQTVFVITTADEKEELLKSNENVAAKLNKLQTANKIEHYSDLSIIFMSDSLIQQKINKWDSFWTENKKFEFIGRFKSSAARNGFKPEAFSGFINQITQSHPKISKEDFNLLTAKYQDVYSDINDSLFLLINTIKVKTEHVKEIEETFKNNAAATVIDRQKIASGFAEVIKDDFNTILLISSAIVFVFLLLLYGRIELAVTAFLPMLITWIWILGIMSLLDIKFNIVSIIISTFIFGLGDDYSIFIMDGLVQEYKRGKKLLNSYKTSVLLSAFTTFTGVGVLIFAKHPALKSVAVLTIIGMLCVVLISYIIAPAMFRILTTWKGKKRMFPVTAYNFLYALVCYGWFLSGCFITAFLGLTIYKLLPLNKKYRKLLYHNTLYLVCRSTMFIMYFTKKKFINIDKNTFRKPAVIIANHQSIIDIPLFLMFWPKVIMITNDAFYNSKLIGIIIKMGGYISASKGYDYIAEKLKSAFAEGYSVFVFPEGTRSNTGQVHRFHKGAFFLAEQLKSDILPLVSNGTGNYIGKGGLLGKKSKITVKALNRISYCDKSWGEDYSARAKNIQHYFRMEFEKLIEDYYNHPIGCKDLIVRNFVYKGPVLEWYTRIKLQIETKNYTIYNQLIPSNARVVDIGCGYGYLSMILGLLNRKRRITGIDFDFEKIETASACGGLPKNVDFFAADITTCTIPDADVYLLSDVLHYIEPDEQKNLLGKCIENLSQGGIILIRDANAELENKHQRTRLTEFFSTRLRFNQTKHKRLFFFTQTQLNEICVQKHAKLSVLDKGSITSNMIYMIEK